MTVAAISLWVFPAAFVVFCAISCAWGIVVGRAIAYGERPLSIRTPGGDGFSEAQIVSVRRIDSDYGLDGFEDIRPVDESPSCPVVPIRRVQR